MSEVWFTSDHHFGHDNIIKFCNRDFWLPQVHPAVPDVKAMNEAMITVWNETVAPTDTVYYVGDLTMGGNKITREVMSKLHGIRHMVSGNHDGCFFDSVRGYQQVPFYHEIGFQTIQERLTFEGYLVCHFPYDVDFRRADGNDRFSGKRPDRKFWNLPLIHGHVHNNNWDDESGHRLRGDDQINVGVDAWDYKPVNFDTIRELL